MNIIGLIGAASDEVRSHKLRVGLSALSIVIGIASLTLIVAIGEIGRSAATVMIERRSGRSATLDIVLERRDPASPSLLEERARIASRLSRYGAYAVSASDIATAMIGAESQSSAVSLVGVDESLAEIRRFRIVEGRWLQRIDGMRFAPLLVANLALARELKSASTQLVGSTFRLTSSIVTTVTVIGLVDDGQQEARAYVMTETVGKLGPSPAYGSRLLAWVPPETVGAIAMQIQLEARRAGFAVEVNRLDDPASLNETITLLQTGLAAIAGLSLVSGAVGILNLGLVTTRHRSREFALRRAFGATKTDIFLIVITETLIMTLLAGVLGLAVAVVGASGLVALASHILDSAEAVPSFPLSAAIVAIVVSATIGVLAGLAPAARATRTSIIEVMRE